MIGLQSTLAAAPPNLTSAQFEQVRRILHGYCGIVLPGGKEGLVRSRLMKRLHLLGIATFEEYLSYVASSSGSGELTAMIDALTTNKTNFFREPQHFEFMRNRLVPGSVAKNQAPCVWSAGCSSGQEPYSLAITLLEALPHTLAAKTRILATDVSTQVLQIAREAMYSADSLHGVSPQLIRKYFTREQSGYRVNPPVQQLVRLAHLNLIRTWPMRGLFDAIFCRNVMIYFDRETQQELVRRFAGLIKPGGYLCVGHSESLFAAGQHGLEYIQPAVYVKAKLESSIQ